MELNIKKSYRSPFSEKQWYIKLIFPIIMNACILFSSLNLHTSKIFILITSLISLLAFIVLFGFYIQLQHNEIQDKIPLLPSLKGKIKDYFIYGINAIGITLIYLIFGIIIFFIASIILKLGGIISILTSIVLNASLFLLLIAAIFAQSSYASDFSFQNSIDLRRVSNLMSKVKLEILMYVLIALPLCIILNHFSKIENIMLVFSPIIMVIMQVILNNLNAQLYKIAKKRLENVVSNPSTDNTILSSS